MSFNRSGYIGRAPGDSSIVLAKQYFQPTGAGKTFTFTAGYDPGLIDVYRNGVKLINVLDYAATDGSTIVLDTPVGVGSTVQVVAYKGFNLAEVNSSGADFNVGTNLYVQSGFGSFAAGVTANEINVSGFGTIGIASITDIRVSGSATVDGTQTFTGNTTHAGTVNVTNTTDSTSSTTGSLIISGGVGIAKNVYIGAGLSIAGTLTYEDVTNVDSVGVITAKSGVHITGGQFQTAYKDIEGVNQSSVTVGSAGVTTFLGAAGVAVTITPATGKVEATTYYGDGSNLSNITSTTINSNADNRLITGSGTANTLNGETNLTFDASTSRLMLGTTTEGAINADNFTIYDSGDCGITLRSGSSSTGNLYFSDGTSGNAEYAGWIEYSHNLERLTQGAGGQVQFTIDTGGSVLSGIATANGMEIPVGYDLKVGTGVTISQNGATGVGIGTTVFLNGDLRLIGENGKNVKWSAANAGLEFQDNALLKMGVGADLQIYHDGTQSIINDSNDKLQIRSDLIQLMTASGKNEYYLDGTEDGAVRIYYDNSLKLATTTSGVTVTGTVSDSAGNVRLLSKNSKGSAYTLVASDSGKFIYCTSTPTITVNNSIFGEGDMITIVNASTSDMSIVQGSGQNLFIPGETGQGNLTLGTYGIMTMLCTASDGSVMWCSGAELTKT